MKFIGRT